MKGLSSKLEVAYLDYQDVVYLHEKAIEAYGGLRGVYPEKLEAKLALPYAGFGDFEKYPTIAEKAAVYLYELARGHCFFDGNKRIAFITTSVFLDFNGYDLNVDDDEVYDFVVKIANDLTRPPFEEVVEWIERFMVKRED